MREQINKVNNQFIINSEGYKYLVDLSQKVKPNDYGYLDEHYNDGINGNIVKVKNERTYPTAKEEGDFDSYKNVWNVEIINKSEIGTNHFDGKVHFSTSYHLSHFNSSKKCGKIIATNNPNISDLPKI